MRADDARRARHGRQTTFVRVADIAVQTGAPAMWPAATGEIRIVGAPADRSAAIARVKEVAALLPPGNDRPPLSGFSLADLEQVAAADGVTLRTLLEELRAAGL